MFSVVLKALRSACACSSATDPQLSFRSSLMVHFKVDKGVRNWWAAMVTKSDLSASSSFSRVTSCKTRMVRNAVMVGGGMGIGVTETKRGPIERVAERDSFLSKTL